MSTAARTLQVSHQYRASIERVFDAWLDPITAGQWLFSTPTGEIVRMEIDARVGGRFVIVEKRDGVDVEHTGENLEIDRPRRLVFTFGVPTYDPTYSTTVTLDLVTTSDGGCILTLTHEGVNQDYWTQTGNGWTTMLANLDATVNASA